MCVQHDCRRPEQDDGAAFDCACAHTVLPGEARRLVRDGHAYWKKYLRPDGRVINDKSAIVLRRRKTPPRARTIDKRDIERAYVDKDFGAEKRIKTYGELSAKVIENLIKSEVESHEI
jgi:hypothetical protein